MTDELRKPARIACCAVLLVAAWSAPASPEVEVNNAYAAISDHVALSDGVEATWACATKKGLTESADFFDRVAQLPDLEAFISQALALLRAAGQSDSPAIPASQLKDPQLRAAGVMKALSSFVKLDANDDMRLAILQQQAAALLALRYAAVAGDACAPSKQFLDLMKRIENEYYQNPRPRNPR